MYRYLIIECKMNKRLDDEIIGLFGEIIAFNHVVKTDHQAILYYEHEVDVSFEDVILNVMSDTLIDLRLYVSYRFQQLDEREHHIKEVQALLQTIDFSKYYYLDDKTLVRHYIHTLTPDMKKLFLGKFYTDTIMRETMNTYLSSNLNMTLASKKLYLHRNTLLQRLDKFYMMTGFDPRIFQDAILIYHLYQ